MDRHLIVVSIDAWIYEDLEYCKTLPNFSRIMENASVIERNRTIYPSVTHAVHATLMTGNTAGVTGIVNNSIFNPDTPDKGSGVWYNSLKQVKCDTIFHAAKRAGLTTAASTWPVTCDGQDVIDYLIPCALNADFEGYEDDPIEVYRRLGTQEFLIPIVEEAVRRYSYKNVHPEFEDFQIYCCAEIIKRYKPNLVFTHPAYVDNQRHTGGVFGENVKMALERTDGWLGMLLSAVKEAGIEDSTDFVLMSDHGQMNITRRLSPNVYLHDKGYITLDENGDVCDWLAYVKSAGSSAHVYLKHPEDEKLYSDVYKLLSDMAEEGIYGFERVYTKDELIEKYKLFGDFSFALETDGYTSFGEWTSRPSVRGFDVSDYRTGKGTHGMEPHKGPQPTFVVSGPSFKKGVIIPEGSVMNHAPTVAAAIGIELPYAEGSPVFEILK